MGADQIDLEFSQFFGGDGNVGKRSKSCVYSIYNFAAGHNVFDETACRFNSGPSAHGKTYFCTVSNFARLFQRQGCAVDLNHFAGSVLERLGEVKSGNRPPPWNFGIS
jgi:hypothetical protein